MLLPPLAERLATPDGLRAYPHPPSLADGPPATRTEAVAFVIERPGSYVFPPLSVDWWNTAAATRATASTAAVTVDVPAPPGWRDRTTAPGTGTARRAAALLAAALAAVVLWRAFRRRSIRRPSERALYRSLRRSIRSDPPGTIRARLAAWTEAGARAPTPELEAALRALERTVYGPPAAPGEARRLRDRLVAEAARLRWSGRSDAGPRLPPLNPPAISARRMI
jgi:hypothetical protein